MARSKGSDKSEGTGRAGSQGKGGLPKQASDKKPKQASDKKQKGTDVGNRPKSRGGVVFDQRGPGPTGGSAHSLSGDPQEGPRRGGR
jgi:hypothetical protein